MGGRVGRLGVFAQQRVRPLIVRLAGCAQESCSAESLEEAHRLSGLIPAAGIQLWALRWLAIVITVAEVPRKTIIADKMIVHHVRR